MKKIERLLLFAMSLTFGFCCFSANTYAIEQAYLIEEPTITTDRDAGTINVGLRFQNLRSGMSNLEYTLYVSDDNYTNPYSEYSSSLSNINCMKTSGLTSFFCTRRMSFFISPMVS